MLPSLYTAVGVDSWGEYLGGAAARGHPLSPASTPGMVTTCRPSSHPAGTQRPLLALPHRAEVRPFPPCCRKGTSHTRCMGHSCFPTPWHGVQVLGKGRKGWPQSQEGAAVFPSLRHPAPLGCSQT